MKPKEWRQSQKKTLKEIAEREKDRAFIDFISENKEYLIGVRTDQVHLIYKDAFFKGLEFMMIRCSK